MADEERKVLKRFRNLDIDGVERPARPKPKPPAPERRDPRPTAPRSATRAPTPAPRRANVPDRPAPRRANVPDAPAPRRANVPDGPAPRGMISESFRIDLTGGASTPPRAATPAPRAQARPRGPEPLPPGTRPGVVTVEMDWGRAGSGAPSPPREEPRVSAPVRATTPPRVRSVGVVAPPTHGERAPIELTPIAARQVRLMAYEHGVVGAGLRILTSGTGGPANCDFAFESEPDPHDVVFLSQGIRVIVDPASLRTLRGRRVTYQDLPGAEGFTVA